jgi:hypothetical protein
VEGEEGKGKKGKGRIQKRTGLGPDGGASREGQRGKELEAFI